MGICSARSKRGPIQGEGNTSQISNMYSNRPFQPIEQNQEPNHNLFQEHQLSQNNQQLKDPEQSDQQQKTYSLSQPIQIQQNTKSMHTKIENFNHCKSNGEIVPLSTRGKTLKGVHPNSSQLLKNNQKEYDELALQKKGPIESQKIQQSNILEQAGDLENQLKIEIEQNGELYFQSSLITIAVDCHQCKLAARSEFLTLPCRHFFHSNCLLNVLQGQINSGKQLVKCPCGHKIHSNFLRSIDLKDKLHLKAKLFQNQLNILFEKYKDKLQFYDYNIQQYKQSLDKSDILASFYPSDLIYTSNLTPS